MPNIIVGNDQLSVIVEDIRTDMNTGKTLRLYQNDFTPGQADHDLETGDFVEATFSGYSAPSLDGDFGAAVKDADGIYSTSSSQHEFEHNGGATNNTIYGFYIDQGSTAVPYAGRFDTPIIVDNGSLPFRIQLQITETAQYP